jgi:CRP/FNR family cyclic AMP-dependent transcriptional regulator
MTGINIFKHATNTVTLEPGEVVFNEGDPGDVMFAVVEGSVDILIGDAVVETVEASGIVGELALVDTDPRSASAIARTAARLARVDRKEFTFLVQEHPTFALQVMRVLAERIRRANDAR